MRFRALSRVHSVLGYIKWAAVFVGAVLGAGLKANLNQVTTHFGPDVAKAVSRMQQSAWLIIPIAMLSIPALDLGRSSIGAPAVWRVIRDVLDQFRSELFNDTTDDPVHEHRVTLFKYQRFHWCSRKWPWKGWLLPVERSGHTTQRTNIAFMAPDEADLVEGVAGMTWARRQVVYVKDLPDLSVDFSAAAVKDYSARSWMPEWIVRQRKPRARAFVGIPVEVKGEVWGVVVVDSRKTVIRQQDVKKHYKFVARFLGQTLEVL